MSKSKWSKIFFSNKGITGIDITVAIIIIITFTGVISGLMYSIYKTSITVQKSAEADAYATIILEKVDEKAYDEVDENFVQKLKEDKEIEISDDYAITFTVETYDDDEFDLIKRVNVTIKYTVAKEEKTLEISKLKIKEIGE